MRYGIRWILLVAPLVSGAGALAQQSNDGQQAAQPIFKEANALMEKREYAKAAVRYQEALEKNPDDTSVLYNAGLAAFLSKDFAAAARLWSRLVKLDPDDWRARAKLVQAHQAAGDMSARDAARAELIAMRKSGKNPELARQDRYCREQLEVAGHRLFAYEFFELKGKFAVRYAFIALKADKDKDVEDFRISLGSYESTNAVAHETGELKEGQRLFHLDGYYQGGSEHRTYGFFPREPGYDEVRGVVIQILEGKKKAVSGTSAHGGE